MTPPKVTLSLLCIGLLAGCNLLPSPPGRILGTVRYQTQPLSGAVVQATVIGQDDIKNWISGRPSNQYSSKADGTYVLDNLHPGDFTVTVDAFVEGKSLHLERKATVRSGIDTLAVDFELSQATAAVTP